MDILAPGPFALSQLHVQWNAAPTQISPAAAAHIAARWREYTAAAQADGKTLFNSAIARGIAFRSSGDDLHLQLGPADYKTFLVTCLRDRPWFLAHAPEAIAPALGNSALLTCGPRAFLGLRSQRVSAYAGHGHLCGGVLDVPDATRPPKCADDLVVHLQRELHEELALTRDAFAAPPVLLGVFRDPQLYQPELVWQWELRHPLTNIHPHEHDALLCIARQDSPAQPLTPIAREALARWRECHARL